MRLMRKVDGMTVDEQCHTVRQKSGCIDSRMCWSSELLVSLGTQIRTTVRINYPQTIEQPEKKYWLLTAQTPCDYGSELF